MQQANEIMKTNGTAVAPYDLTSIDKFTARLNVNPPESEVEINKQAGGKKYLPISFVQMKLDETFLGMWSWKVRSFQVVANEILVQGDLEVFHPIAKQWITRSGTGAAMIQQTQGAEITDISKKIKNTLVKDFPHAEVEALKNAAKKLGKVFGRDLNRGILSDDYTSVEESLGAEESFEATVKAKLDGAKTLQELKQLMKANREWEKSDWVLQQFVARKRQLENAQMPPK